MRDKVKQTFNLNKCLILFFIKKNSENIKTSFAARLYCQGKIISFVRFNQVVGKQGLLFQLQQNVVRPKIACFWAKRSAESLSYRKYTCLCELTLTGTGTRVWLFLKNTEKRLKKHQLKHKKSSNRKITAGIS